MTDQRTLSLSELNAISADFGLVFEAGGGDRVWANTIFIDVRLALADKCEELGSRWCDAIRREPKSLHTIWLHSFTLVD